MYNEKQTVSDLVSAVALHMKTRGYSQLSLSRTASIHCELLKYCSKNNIIQFTAKIGQDFMLKKYGLKPGVATTKWNYAVRRAITMISDFQQLGTIMLKRKKKRIFPAQFTAVQGFLDELKSQKMCENTFKTYYTRLHRLFDFLNEQSVKSFSELTSVHLVQYTKLVLCHYTKAEVCGELSVMRKITVYLYKNGFTQTDLSIGIMHISAYRIPRHLPSTFEQDEIDAMLATIDRRSPLGKRDYAILLIAVKLGLRSSDIRALKFDSIDWEQNLIRLTQIKTKEPLVLPLMPDVGWALIDYIKNGRPASNFPEIFVQQVAPHEPFQNLDNVLVRAMQKAKIKPNRIAHHGLHALRHTLASTLLENETPIYVIQEILGHVNSHTTARYTSIDINQLKTCALEVSDL